MSRTHDVEGRTLVERRQRLRRNEAVETNAACQTEFGRGTLHLAGKGVDSGYVECQLGNLASRLRDRSQHRVLVLHPVQTGDVHEPERVRRRARSETVRVHAERNHVVGCPARRSDLTGKPFAGDCQSGRRPNDVTADQSATEPLGTAVTDVGQRHEFPTRNVHDARASQHLAGADGNEAADARPEPVNHVRAAMAPNCTNPAGDLAGQSTWPVMLGRDIHDGGTQQRVAARSRFLSECDNEHIVAPRELFDQPEQRRNYPLSAAAIHAAGNDQNDADSASVSRTGPGRSDVSKPHSSASRADQHELLRWVLGSINGSSDNGELWSWPIERLAPVGFASGLSAAVSVLAGPSVPDSWRGYLGEQRAAVADRCRRFADLLPQVLAVLERAEIDVIPVKGAVLTFERWPWALARPMADLDFIVAPWHRRAAARALDAAGFVHVGAADWEDTFVGWPADPGARRDGESAGHAGKVELHPGWVERIHGYQLDASSVLHTACHHGDLLGQPCLRLSEPAFALQVLGHLSATVIRCEARPLNVVDAVLLLDALSPPDTAELAELCGRVDARLVAPALWLVRFYRNDLVAESMWRAAQARLPRRAADALSAAEAPDVFRGAATRTTMSWRLAFASSLGEAAGVLQQAVAPSAAERSETSLFRTQLRRAYRLAGRAR